MSKFDYTKAGTLGWEAVAKAVLVSRERLAETDAQLQDGTVRLPDGTRAPKLIRLRDSARVWKVWSACVEMTAGHKKRADKIYVTQIAAAAGVRPDKVSPILRLFDDVGIFS